MAVDPRFRQLLTFLVMAGAAGLFLGRLGERALWSEEVRWAEIPREMVQSGNLFWPTINGRTYYDKPVGSYWLVLIAALPNWEVTELAARLPSALSGVLAVGLLIALTRRFIVEDRVAVLAGAVLATSFGFVFFARTASADVETIAGVLASLWIGTGSSRWSARRTLAFWLVMSVTSQTKGLLGIALPLLVLVSYHTFATEGDKGSGLVGRVRAVVARNGWLLNRWTAFAAPLAVTAYLAPFAVSVAQTGSDEGLAMVWRENVRRFFDAHNHRGPAYLYSYVILGLLAPWSPLLPAALLRAHQTRDHGDRFALAFFWAVFLFFTLSSSRRSYYLLPVLPAAAILVARVILTEASGLSLWVRKLRVGGYALTAAGAVTAGLAAFTPLRAFGTDWAELPELPRLDIFLAGWVAAVVCVAGSVIRFTPGRMAVALVVIASWGMGYGYLVALPDLEHHRTTRPLLEHVRETTSERPTEVALYRTSEVVWYLVPGTPLTECGSVEELADRLKAGSSRWGLIKAQDLGPVAERLRVVEREHCQP